MCMTFAYPHCRCPWCKPEHDRELSVCIGPVAGRQVDADTPADRSRRGLDGKAKREGDVPPGALSLRHAVQVGLDAGGTDAAHEQSTVSLVDIVVAIQVSIGAGGFGVLDVQDTQAPLQVAEIF